MGDLNTQPLDWLTTRRRLMVYLFHNVRGRISSTFWQEKMRLTGGGSLFAYHLWVSVIFRGVIWAKGLRSSVCDFLTWLGVTRASNAPVSLKIFGCGAAFFICAILVRNGMVSYAARIKSPKNIFLSVRYRVTRASRSKPGRE